MLDTIKFFSGLIGGLVCITAPFVAFLIEFSKFQAGR